MITEQTIKYRKCWITIVAATLYYCIIYGLCIHWWFFSEHRTQAGDICCVSIFVLSLLANIHAAVSSIKDYRRVEKDEITATIIEL